MTDQPTPKPPEMAGLPNFPALVVIDDRAIRLDRILAVEPRETRHCDVVLESPSGTARIQLDNTTVWDVLQRVNDFGRAVMAERAAQETRGKIAGGIGPGMAKGKRPSPA